jgi:ketosteroid isomerase-like protein
VTSAAPEESNATQRRNLEISRRLVELYESEGPWAVEQRFEEFFHPEFVWRPAVSAIGARTYLGREGFRNWQEDMEMIADQARQTDFALTALGDRVVLVLSRMRIVGKESGASFESEYGAVYEMEDGRGVSGRAFLSHADATRAAEEAGDGTAVPEGQTG